jgi:acetyltransferase-like isoleucine patch superfamily enzyme
MRKIGENGARDSFRKAGYYLRGLYYRIHFEHCGPIQVTGRIYVIKRNARIEIGKCIIWKHVKIDMEGNSPEKAAVLEIGDFTTIGDRTEIHVAEKVIIGKRCRIAWDCVIMDRNYHGMGSGTQKVSPVLIEDNVWIGCRAIILPGLQLGLTPLLGLARL